MRKKKYVLNPDTFQYEPAKLDVKLVLRQAAYCMGLGFSLALGFLGYSAANGYDIEAEQLAEENAELAEQLAERTQEMKTLEASLDKIYKTDNYFFRSLLNVTPVDASVWNAGTGGSRAEFEGLPQELREAYLLQEKVAYKLDVQAESYEEINEVMAYKAEELKHLPAVRPVPGRVLSGFGYRADPFLGYSHFHAGVDFHGRFGDPVVAVGDGKVIAAGYDNLHGAGYGMQVEIDHGYGYVTKYAHLSAVHVKLGDVVPRGKHIGNVGSTGHSTGPHLHYEVIKNGVKVNPLDFFYSE